MTRVKCCGLRRAEDIDMINRMHADFAGFIMSSRFWRYVEPARVKELTTRLDEGIQSVGVFVNEPAEYVAEQLNSGTVDMAQLHGNEDNAYISSLRSMLRGGNKIIKAFRITSATDIENAVKSEADYILLDSGTGTGEAFDWSLMTRIERPYFFAGGLNPDNVEDAVKRFHPFAVDVSSGIETDRAKDFAKVEAFILNARKEI